MGQWLTKIVQRPGRISMGLLSLLAIFCGSFHQVHARDFYYAPMSQQIGSNSLAAQTPAVTSRESSSTEPLLTAMPIITPTPVDATTPEPNSTILSTPQPTPTAMPTATAPPSPTLLATATPFVIPIGVYKGFTHKLYLPISYE
ncbi:MAG: hypothetical protein R3A44_29995 [Caldilineaceae bacterium]